MKDLRIGQSILVNVFSDVDYVEFPPFDTEGSGSNFQGSRRGIVDRPCLPIRAVVIGQVVKQLGTYQACRGGDWEDLDPAHLAVSGTVTLWQVRIGMLNKPLLVRDENIEPCETFDLPRKSHKPYYETGLAAA